MKLPFGVDRKTLREAFRMAWPSVLESFFVAFAGIVDSYMVSSLGAYAVAAVGLTTQPKFLALALFIATNVAVSALTARRKGEEDRDGANRVLVNALMFTAVAGIIVSILCVALADPIIQFSGSKADTHASAVLYFRIIMGGMIFNIISLVINAAMRGVGNTKIAMKTNVISNTVNIIFNYLLIDGHFGFPALGITGAALATVLGTVIACALSFRVLLKSDNYINLWYILKNKIGISIKALRGIFKISSNVFVEQVLIRIGFMSVAVMAAHQGTQAYAAHQVGMNIMSLSFSFGDGLQAAAVALIGQSLGANNLKLAKKYGSACQMIGMTIALCLSVLYMAGGRWLYMLFFEEPEIIEIGVNIMRITVIIVLFQVPQVIYMGCLRGAGDVRYTMIASSISVTGLRPLASYLLCYTAGLGITGIWLGVVTDQISRFILTSVRFYSGKWINIKI